MNNETRNWIKYFEDRGVNYCNSRVGHSEIHSVLQMIRSKFGGREAHEFANIMQEIIAGVDV